ncbi:ATP-dependent DNA helicase RecG [Mycobacterium kansasii]|nr:ATP-dependent DNA helicase RecG [Mycobacterium kansasii]POY08242.1 ATP-dependent DNA helicase RecG [Mycobacterium kansasii]POY24046.1 ATP-dependent DNA helicase RecG [Mycobacterium kansasii]
MNDGGKAVVLETEESHTADLKAIEIVPAKLTRTLSAFANAEGGELYIGVDEDKSSGVRTWRGFADVEAANGHLQALEATFPLGQFVDYQFLRLESAPNDGLVLKVSILKTPDVRRSSDGSVYVRRGAQNLPVADRGALQRLEYLKGVSSFESHPVEVPIDLVSDSFTVTEFLMEVVPTVDAVEPWLRKQLLIRDEKPTVAALLLFSDEPQVALPKQSTIKVYRYATSDAEGSRANLQGQPITIEGPAYDVIKDAVRTAVDTVQAIRVLGPTGLERISYPEVTLHEIITNAVLHRDYSIADDIHVRIFDNRVEVESPGGLPAHITPENILDQRFSRNGSIVRWISKFPDPPNKDVGEGLNTAFKAMRDLKLKPPEVEDRSTSVLIRIRHERLASPEQIITEYLQSHDEITNSTVRQLTGIGSENQVKTIFKNMIRSGALERIPGRSQRYAAYRLPTPASSASADEKSSQLQLSDS